MLAQTSHPPSRGLLRARLRFPGVCIMRQRLRRPLLTSPNTSTRQISYPSSRRSITISPPALAPRSSLYRLIALFLIPILDSRLLASHRNTRMTMDATTIRRNPMKRITPALSSQTPTRTPPTRSSLNAMDLIGNISQRLRDSLATCSLSMRPSRGSIYSSISPASLATLCSRLCHS